MNSHPGLFSRVRQSKHFLMSRPCVSCPNNRIFFLTNCKLFLVVVFSHFQASSTRIRIFLKKEISLSIVEKKRSPYFQTKLRPEGPKKLLETGPPSLSQGLDDCLPPPSPPLSDGLNPPLSWPNTGGNWSRFQTNTFGRGLRKKLCKKIHKKEIYIRSNQSTLQVSY